VSVRDRINRLAENIDADAPSPLQDEIEALRLAFESGTETPDELQARERRVLRMYDKWDGPGAPPYPWLLPKQG
jgi:hypothetical protein